MQKNDIVMKREIAIAICLTIVLLDMCPTMRADEAKPLEQAVAAYNGQDYNQALGIYLEQAKVSGTSSDLYYNIGCTYYRLKDYPHAILYYERALKLDPSNRAARNNLTFVREKAQISDEDSLSSVLGNALFGLFSSNGWAWIGLVSFLLTLCGVAMYVFLDNVTLRKSGFFGAIVLLLLSVVSVVASTHNRNLALSSMHGIVVGNQATFSTAPRMPKDSSEVVLRLTPGHKIEIVDSIGDSKNAGESWYDVRTSGSKRAWVKAKDIEVI